MENKIAVSSIKQLFEQACIEKGHTIDFIDQYIEMYDLDIDPNINKSTWLVTICQAICNLPILRTG